MEYSLVKLETYIPAPHLAALRRALQEADAGHIGNYDSCLAFSPVTGVWRALAGAQPHIGAPGEVSEAPEIKVEVTLRAAQVEDAVRAVRRVHPYEEPVINLIPLLNTQ